MKKKNYSSSEAGKLDITWQPIWLESDRYRDLGVVSWNIKVLEKMMIESEAAEPCHQRECCRSITSFFAFKILSNTLN